jgi:drug/metabolite transporter (DMT)-like permease
VTGTGEHPGPAAAPVRGWGPRSQARGTASLAVAALLFGSTFLVVKHAVSRVDPTPFLGVRFLIAAVVLWPLARRRSGTQHELAHGLLAGSALLAGYLLQTYGLQRTTGSRSAFITYLLVVIVPLMEAVLLRRRPRLAALVGAGLAVGGLVLLTSVPEAASSTAPHGLGWGEVLTLLCAFFFAAHIVILGRVAHHHDPVRFTMVQLLVVGLVCSVLGVGAGYHGFDGSVWVAAAFTGVFATAAAFVLMVSGQRVVPASRAALLLILEPVFAALLGYANGDRLGVRGWLGAAVILVAIVLADTVHHPAPETASTIGAS